MCARAVCEDADTVASKSVGVNTVLPKGEMWANVAASGAAPLAKEQFATNTNSPNMNLTSAPMHAAAHDEHVLHPMGSTRSEHASYTQGHATFHEPTTSRDHVSSCKPIHVHLHSNHDPSRANDSSCTPHSLLLTQLLWHHEHRRAGVEERLLQLLHALVEQQRLTSTRSADEHNSTSTSTSTSIARPCSTTTSFPPAATQPCAQAALGAAAANGHLSSGAASAARLTYMVRGGRLVPCRPSARPAHPVISPTATTTCAPAAPDLPPACAAEQSGSSSAAILSSSSGSAEGGAPSITTSTADAASLATSAIVDEGGGPVRAVKPAAPSLERRNESAATHDHVINERVGSGTAVSRSSLEWVMEGPGVGSLAAMDLPDLASKRDSPNDPRSGSHALGDDTSACNDHNDHEPARFACLGPAADTSASLPAAHLLLTPPS